MRESFHYSTNDGAGPIAVTCKGKSLRWALAAALTAVFIMAAPAGSVAGVIHDDAHDNSQGVYHGQSDRGTNDPMNGLDVFQPPTQPVAGPGIGDPTYEGSNNFIGIGHFDFNLPQNGTSSDSSLTGGDHPHDGEGPSFHAEMFIHDRMFDSFAGLNTPVTPPLNPDPAPQGAVPEPLSVLLWSLGGLALVTRRYAPRLIHRMPRS